MKQYVDLNRPVYCLLAYFDNKNTFIVVLPTQSRLRDSVFKLQSAINDMYREMSPSLFLIDWYNRQSFL